MPSCTSPITLRKGERVPCGQCMCCRVSKSQEWVTRMQDELKFHLCSVFLTLTYNEENIPKDNSINKREAQLFLKRLRDRRGSFRYYLCGEYGEQTFRPHYHAILFGVGEDERVIIEDCWGKGNIFIGSVEKASIGYCTKYIQKKINGLPSDDYYKGRTKEFALVSRRPGLGYKHAVDNIDMWIEKGYIFREGKKLPIPRYYRDMANEEDLANYRANRSFGKFWKLTEQAIVLNTSIHELTDKAVRENPQRDLNMRSKLSMKKNKL